MILRERYTFAIDMWAVGCIFKELLELTPASKFRTGALFPGRYCIPFSFDDDQRERQRHDQLAVIIRTVGAVTPAEVSWMAPQAQEELRAVLPGGVETGVWSTLDGAERRAQLDARLAEACPVALTGSSELALLRALLEFNPAERPDAYNALKLEYFQYLPEVEQPVLTPAPEPREIEAAFAFERETLGANELRILIANDLFRMHLEDDEPTSAAAAVDALSSSATGPPPSSG